MKIIIKFFASLLLLLVVNAHDVSESLEYCENLITECKQNFTSLCAYRKYVINTCCDLQIFEPPSGIYKLKMEEFDTRHVYCDMDTDDGGWIVIQRNKKDSKVSFTRKWDEYETGFGDLNTEFWYGLKGLSCLTLSGNWEMRLDYQKTDKTWSYLHYTQFKVGSGKEKYPLTIAGFTLKSTNFMASSNGLKFSTPGVDNDRHGSYHCARSYSSGWWYYYNCASELNINRAPPYVSGNVLATEMKIRYKDCLPSNS